MASMVAINNKAQEVFRRSVAAGNSSYANGAARSGGLPPTGLGGSTTTPSSASSVGSVSGLGGSDYLSGALAQIQSLTSANNAWSAAQADKQMQFQQASADKAMQFEADQAKLNRDWQEYMSNTAHQREVKDLQAAGINPVLTATGGSGAPVTSGATASGYSGQGAKGDTDESGASSLVALLGSMLQSQTALLSQSMSAQNALAVADKYTAASRFGSLLSANTAQRVAETNYKQGIDVASINSGTSIQVAKINASSNITAHQISAMGQQAAAAISGQYHLSAARETALASIINTQTTALAKKYGDDLNAATQSGIAAANRDLQREMQQAGFDFQLEYQFNQQTHELELQKRGFLMDLSLNAEKALLDGAKYLALFG